MPSKIAGCFVSGRKKAIKPSTSGKIVAPVSSDFSKIFSEVFLYRQIVHGKARGVRKASFFPGCE